MEFRHNFWRHQAFDNPPKQDGKAQYKNNTDDCACEKKVPMSGALAAAVANSFCMEENISI